MLTGKATIIRGLGRAFRRLLSCLSGRISTPSQLDELLRALRRGDFDLVGSGPCSARRRRWAQKIHEGHSAELIGF